MMRYAKSLSGLLILLCGSALAETIPNPLLAERSKYRPLIIMSPNDNDPMLRAIDRALNDQAIRAALMDRAMVLYVLSNQGATRNGEPLQPKQVQAIVAVLQQSQPYKPSTYLIGLDGGIKLVQEHQLDLQAIFTLIDGMPMRQQQLR
jgi:hypothetical protein